MNAQDITEPNTEANETLLTEEALPTQPENDAPPLPDNTTPEQNVILNIIEEKRKDIEQFVNVLKLANQVPENETPPYDAVQIDDAATYLSAAFQHLNKAVRGA